MGKKRSKTQGDLSGNRNENRSQSKNDDLHWDRLVITGKGVYEGFLKNNRREGMGTFKEKNGTIYRGLWMNDEPHGAGLKVILCIFISFFTLYPSVLTHSHHCSIQLHFM